MNTTVYDVPINQWPQFMSHFSSAVRQLKFGYFRFSYTFNENKCVKNVDIKGLLKNGYSCEITFKTNIE